MLSEIILRLDDDDRQRLHTCDLAISQSLDLFRQYPLRRAEALRYAMRTIIDAAGISANEWSIPAFSLNNSYLTPPSPSTPQRYDVATVADLVREACDRQDITLVVSLHKLLTGLSEQPGGDILRPAVDHLHRWAADWLDHQRYYEEATAQWAGSINRHPSLPGQSITDDHILRALRYALGLNAHARTLRWVGLWFAWRKDPRLQPRPARYPEFVSLMNSDRFIAAHPDDPCTDTFLRVYASDIYLDRHPVIQWTLDAWKASGVRLAKARLDIHFPTIHAIASAFLDALPPAY